MRNIYSKSRGILIGLFVLVMAAGGVLTQPSPARAFPVEIIADAQKTIKEASGGAFAGAFLSGMQYFINKIAYDSAVWLASGGKGQKPLLFSEPGKYFKDTALDATGEALANLNNLEFLKKAGINLCMPPDLNLSLRIKMDIANTTVNPPIPKCRWDDIAKAYEKIGEPGYWSKIGIAFEPGQNDLSIYMAANNAIIDYSLRKELAARDDAAHKGETKTPVDPVTGKPTVSKEVAKTTAESGSPSEQAKKTEAQANALTPSILDGTWGALILGAKTFTNTLASQLMQRLTTQGFFSGLEGVCYLTDNQQKFCPQNTSSATAQGSFGGKTSAALAFADLLTPKIFTVNDYDSTLIAELGACDPAHRGLYSCAADGGLLAAVQQAKSGTILSVQQAIEQGFLHKEWQLIPPGSVADNQDPYCFTRAYCYANLVKLRQANILPVGWELAATQSNFKQPYTLDFFVKNFNNANTIAYHLIDPNWLIKLPPTQCKARVFGQFLAAEGTANRAEYCADLATCVNEDAQGGCSSGQYGYCRQTKNIWRLSGDACPEQFNTCTALVSRAGEAAAYVSETINKGVCDAQNVGCRAYSNTQKFEGEQGDWQWQGAASQLAYFDKDAEACSAEAEGCSRFIRQSASVNGQELNMRKAPDYYHCYDGNAIPLPAPSSIFTGVQFSSSTLNWPANHTDLVKLDTSLSAEQKQQCGRFARVCSAEENGCEAYTPANGDPQVTGNITASDVCPQECVGYESFIQQSSFFEPLQNPSPAYFIPSTGDACNADNAGCDEFVNIEKSGEQKSFFTELHLCSKDSADGATYYTWEGSDTTGYQLKSYVMKKDGIIASQVGENIIGDGKGEAPAYLGSNVQAKLSDYAARCNKTAYANRLTDKNFDTDCREFYDKDGHISYRLWSQTITVDASACQKFRKSVSYGATMAERETTCKSTYGTWETNTNTCVYLAIPSEANTCEAKFNGCRAYKGNSGNNYQIIDTSTFEQATLLPWSGGTLSSESTTQGGHSAKIIKKTKEKVLERVFASSTAAKGSTYLVSFWAKGTAGKKVSVGLYKGATADGASASSKTNENSFALSNNWAVYAAGPFTVDWTISEDATLAFKPSDQSADIFIDTISVRKMQDMVYVVHNSWETPASCDNPLTDPDGSSAGGTADAPVATVPQAMLGCSAYTDRAGKGVFVKSFTNICRAKAVGCEELVDTANTPDQGTQYANALCQLQDNSKISPFISFHANGVQVNGFAPINNTNLPLPCKNAGGEVLCSIAPGQKACRFTRVIEAILSAKAIKGGTSDPINPIDANKNNKLTFELLADDQTNILPDDHTVYLVNDSAYYCSADALGCTAYGQRSWVATSTLQTAGGVQASYATTYIKNTPDNYDKISCQPEAEGCEQYSTSKGGQTYFKDPKVWGNFICEWRDNVEYGSALYNGWFRTGGVGFCGVKGASPTGLANDKITQCAADSDCDKGQVCNQPLPCYPQYIVDGTTFGIYRAGDAGYNKITNPVGQCPAKYDSCSEFVDPSDALSANSQGKAYYVLDNKKLDKASCGGQVSKGQGCVLFDKTSEVNYKPWKSKDTYTASETSGGALVKPVESAGGIGGDANTILKVKRDRVCGEWLTCGSSQDAFDQNTAKTVKQCLTLQSCVKPISTSVSGVGSVGNCGEYGAMKTVDDAFNKNTMASLSAYKARFVGFAATEYTGYSIPLSYPIEFYKPVHLTDKNKTSLAFAYCPITSGVNCETDSKKNQDSTMCITVFAACGVVNSPQGKCDANHRCAISDPPQKSGGESVNIQSGLLCRGYPASDAPFSFNKTSVNNIQNARPLKYKDVNTCVIGNNSKTQDCECSYNVALYGDPNKGDQQKKGFFEPSKDPPAYICSGGENDGGAPLECPPATGANCSCDPDKQKDCVKDGGKTLKCFGGGILLNKFKFDNQYVGWEDYCLEHDTSQVLYYKDNKPVYPCLTWYPVDKAPGAVDIYAQHKEAGYSLTSNAYYCAAGDVMMTKMPSGEKCSYIGACGWQDYKECLDNTSCPMGYFAVVGTCDTGGGCDTAGTSFFNDGCPYKCIPNDSVFDAQKDNFKVGDEIGGFDSIYDKPENKDAFEDKIKSGKSCYEAGKFLADKMNSAWTKYSKEGLLTAISVGVFKHNENADPKDHIFVENFMKDCLTYGVDPGNQGAWYRTNFACREIAQTSDISQNNTINKAWTDRLQDTKFILPVVEPSKQNATQMAYNYTTPPPHFGAASQPTEKYPLMFPVCLNGKVISLPDPITFACANSEKLTNEQVQARPYQFDAIALLTTDICNTDKPSSDAYYACLSGANASPVDGGYNILSAAGKAFCAKDPKKTNKECFDDFTKNLTCQKSKSQPLVCVKNKEKLKEDLVEKLNSVFKKQSSCTQASDCVFDQNYVKYVSCVDNFVCTGVDETLFRPGFWNNVLCDKDNINSCKTYAEKGLKEMCTTQKNVQIGEEGTTVQSCAGVVPATSVTLEFSNGIKRIQQIFTKMMKMWKWTPPTSLNGKNTEGKYETDEPFPDTKFGNTLDNAFELGKTKAGGLPPQIHPLDGQNNNAEVKDAGQGFSVNGVYGIPASTPSSSGKLSGPAYLVQEGQLLATLSFYGFADKNHMPLRRIAIDWGDGTDIVGNGELSPVNYYKNKREKCSPDENGAGGGWAGNSQACDSGEPFAYQHTYLFKKAELDSNHCGLIGPLLGGAFTDFQKQFPNIAQNKPACVYTPKVQLLDNWGWCNASGIGGNAGCWDFKNGVFGCYADWKEASSPFNNTNFCQTNQEKNAWTAFAGKVIVLP